MPNPKPTLTAEQIAAGIAVLQDLQRSMNGPPPRPASMTPEQHEEHIAASKALTERWAEHDENPRDFVLALADRVAALEAKAEGKAAPKKAKA